MRKQMRSTFRTPGTEDGNVNGNAHRSRGAELLLLCFAVLVLLLLCFAPPVVLLLLMLLQERIG
jgi:hypothetical protein